MENNSIKNDFLYRKYAMSGIPNFFLSVQSTYTWNDYVEKLCNSLPEGSIKLPVMSRAKLFLFSLSLGIKDLRWYKEEKIQHKES